MEVWGQLIQVVIYGRPHNTNFPSNRPEYLPPSIPADLKDTLVKHHGDPPVWWVSQMIKYLMRPHPNLRAVLEVAEFNYGLGNFSSQDVDQPTPLVGVQIRRTDKYHEAQFYDVAEYMRLVWFKFILKAYISNQDIE